MYHEEDYSMLHVTIYLITQSGAERRMRCVADSWVQLPNNAAWFGQLWPFLYNPVGVVKFCFRFFFVGKSLRKKLNPVIFIQGFAVTLFGLFPKLVVFVGLIIKNILIKYVKYSGNCM
jgi:hypothetical protein